MGNFSKAVAEAIKEAEKRTDELQAEINALQYQKETTFKAPLKNGLTIGWKN